MSSGEIASQLVSALEAEADSEAGGRTALVSVTIDVLASPAEGEVTITLNRKTRTLVFLNADLRNAGGQSIATAASVHKVLP